MGVGEGLSRSRHFREQFIDRQIDNFLEDLEGSLDSVNSLYVEVLLARDRSLSEPSRPQRKEARGRLEDSLKQLSKEAKSLRKKLSLVLSPLKLKRRFRVSFTPESAENGFQREIDWIGEEINKAERQINDYFFVPSHTVQVSELRGENVLTHLNRVHKLSEQVRRKLKMVKVGGCIPVGGGLLGDAQDPSGRSFGWAAFFLPAERGSARPPVRYTS